MAAKELDMDAINLLLAGSKTRGDYRDELINFIGGDAAGIEVDLSSGALTGKDPKNVATGFNNARKKMNEDGTPNIPGGPQVKVLLKWVNTGEKDAEGKDVRDGHVFLINLAKVAGDATPAPDDVEEEQAA